MGLGAPFALAYAAPAKNGQRALGAALVALLHLLLLLAALRAVTNATIGPQREHEMTLILPRLPPPEPRSQAAPVPRMQSPRAITLPPPPTPPPVAPVAPDIQGLGQTLFGCAPENLGNLTPEQRAHCGGSGIAPSDGLAVVAPRSHVKDAELRAAEMEKKNTPMTVPCTRIETQSLGNNSEQQVLMVDPICAIRERNR